MVAERNLINKSQRELKEDKYRWQIEKHRQLHIQDECNTKVIFFSCYLPVLYDNYRIVLTYIMYHVNL